MKVCHSACCLLLSVVSTFAALPSERVHEIVNPRFNPQMDDAFGAALAATNDYVAIGVPRGEPTWSSGERGVVKVGGLYPGQTFIMTDMSVTNPDHAGGSGFGSAVAIHGSLETGPTRVVGAPFNVANGESNQGKVYVYSTMYSGIDAPNLTLTSPSPPGGGGDIFGRAVAVNDAYIIASAAGIATAAAGAGIVYVYDRASATPAVPTWSIPNPSPAASEAFGFSLALLGTKLHVGDPGEDGGRGRVYVYDLASGTPTVPVLTITSPMAATETERFGAALSVDGNMLAVGAPEGLGLNGRAYVFDVASGTPATPLLNLENPDPFIWEAFGSSVAVRGTRVAVGCPSDLPDLGNFLGSVYVYDLASATPAAAVRNIQSPVTPQGGEAFGHAVVFGSSADDLVIGAPGNDRVAPNAGDVHRFTLQGVNAPTFLGSYNDLSSVEEFGHAADMDGDRVIVAEGQTLYAYDLASATPTTPYFTTPVMNPATDDRKIYAASISGTRVAVSVETGVQANQNTGRVYVFDLALGSSSAPILVLDCPLPTSGVDRYGEWLDLSGNWLAVGAPGQRRAFVYDLSSATPSVPVISNEYTGGFLAMSGSLVVMLDHGQDTAKLYDMTSATPNTPVITRTYTGPTPLDVSLDGHRFAIGRAGDMKLYDLDSPNADLGVRTFTFPYDFVGDYGRKVSLRGNHLYVSASSRSYAAVQVRAVGYDLSLPQTSSTQPPQVLLIAPEYSPSSNSILAPLVQSGSRVLVATPSSNLHAYAKGSVSIHEPGAGQIVVERVSGAAITPGGSVPLGYLAANEQLTASVVVRNTGTTSLQLTGSVPGTSSFLNGVSISTDNSNFPVILAPGGSATVTCGSVQCYQFGPQWVEAGLYSSDAAMPVFTIRFEVIGVTILESWRNRYFGTILSEGIAADGNDADSDGHSNYDEFVLGSVPTDSDSRQRVQIEPHPWLPGQKRILITPYPNPSSRIKVYASNDLSPGSWQLIWNRSAPYILVEDPGSEGESRRFYKVEITLP